jgi:uncharacterized damage-inducible protein DinB
MNAQTIGSTFKVVQFGRSYLLNALERCTPEVLDYRPQPKDGMRLYSLREQFLHIADVSEQFIWHAVLCQHKPDGSWRIRYEAPGQWTLSGEWAGVGEIRGELEKGWAFEDQHVFNRPLNDLIALVGPPDKQRTLAEEVAWLVFHESQHRGQVMQMLRMAGIEPPEW